LKFIGIYAFVMKPKNETEWFLFTFFRIFSDLKFRRFFKFSETT
jgi:hypothetical protein